jgi:cytochrome P450
MVGHETTGGSLVFILWELARQPAIQVIKIVSHLSLQLFEEVMTLIKIL